MTTLTDARAVANWYLAKAAVEQDTIDPLKLMKLVYITHGWNLGFTGKPLFFQRVMAWPHGPVIPEVYHAFKLFGYNPIRTSATFYDHEDDIERPYEARFDEMEISVLQASWSKYKPYTGSQLEDLTHLPGTPWSEVTAGLPPGKIRNVPMPNEIIQKHYEAAIKLNRKRKLEQHRAQLAASAG